MRATRAAQALELARRAEAAAAIKAAAEEEARVRGPRAGVAGAGRSQAGRGVRACLWVEGWVDGRVAE